ncbi:hypothetical protein [Umezawaea tangerina]|uniref:Uncharacterized protein n=1 Tax=Umezawaea tangerina TaxID=84725 RepID=A0A2T0TKH9_9PSEU|nr:hypothetical protein [Umezawaea tangerina]PRY46224.1 hypothetical protein CLV43_101496 [Umezawaea tangerina]
MLLIANGYPSDILLDPTIDQVGGFIRRIDIPPSQPAEGTESADSDHFPTLRSRQNPLVVVYTETAIRSRLHR